MQDKPSSLDTGAGLPVGAVDTLAEQPLSPQDPVVEDAAGTVPSEPDSTDAQTGNIRLPRKLTPELVGGLLVVLAIILGGWWLVNRPAGTQGVVIFDPVKFINAQRAAVSVLQATPSADMSLMVTQVASQAESVIREKAKGATVLVRQSVVLPDDFKDITDEVLTHFGLPTDAPSVTTNVARTNHWSEIAPSDTSFSREALREDQRVEMYMRENAARAALQTQDRQKAVLP